MSAGHTARRSQNVTRRGHVSIGDAQPGIQARVAVMAVQSECPGTSLAPDAAVGDPRPADIWCGQRNRFLIEDGRQTGQWLHLAGGIVQLAVLLIFLDGGYPTWRAGAAAAVFVSFALLQTGWLRSSHDALSFDRVFIGIN